MYGVKLMYQVMDCGQGISSRLSLCLLNDPINPSLLYDQAFHLLRLVSDDRVVLLNFNV